MSSEQRSGFQHRATRVRAAGMAVFALCALAWHLPCSGLDFQQPGAVINLQQFKTQGRSEQGARWWLDGQSAVIRGTVYELTGVVLQLEDDSGKTAVIRAQACTYYQDSGLVESDAAVRVESGTITLDGVGFDILLAERRLRVRDAVRMEVPGARASLGTGMPSRAPAAPATKTKTTGP